MRMRLLCGLLAACWLVATGLAGALSPAEAAEGAQAQRGKQATLGKHGRTKPAQARRSVSPAARKTLAKYGQLPLSFVPNEGQTNSRVRYYAQTGGATFYFAKQEAVFSLSKETKGLALKLSFVGSNPNAAVSGYERQPGKVNYFLGNRPARWQTNLPTYEGVVYRNLWPGIDLVFRGVKGQLKYEFRVAPGANPEHIELAYAGARALTIDRSGNLLLHTAAGRIKDTRPVSYQVVAGKRVAVASRYALTGKTYGFSVGAYDRSRALVIDPGLAYSTYLGGAADDLGHDVAVDQAGKAHVTGSTRSLDFPTTIGGYDITPNGNEDVFVTKLNSSGTALVYSTYLGAQEDEPYWGASIEVDRYGRAYVAGTTLSPNFPTTPGAYDRTFNGYYDAFVVKLSSGGDQLLYSTFIGGSDADGPYYYDNLDIDSSGKAYITGFTYSADYPTRNAYDSTYNGVEDAFVTKLNSSGSALVYSTYLGTTDFEDATGIAVDRYDRAYVTGYTFAPDFPTTPGAYQPANGGPPSATADAFVTKFSSSGTSLAYSTYLGGALDDYASSIAVDWAGKAHVTGVSYSADFDTTPGAFQTAEEGAGDTFVTKLNSSGTGLQYSTYLGGLLYDQPDNITLDDAGQAIVTGFTASPDYDTTANAYDTTFNGAGPPWFYGDVFVTRLNGNGTDLTYSTYIGGLGDDLGAGVDVDSNGKIYVTGSTNSLNYPTTIGAFDETYNGAGPPYSYGDAFVTKLDTGRGDCPPGEDDDNDGLKNSREAFYFALTGNPDTDLDGVKDGNDDSNRNGDHDEDEDDEDDCDEDGDGDGKDDEDEDDEDGQGARTWVNDFERTGDDMPVPGDWWDEPPATIDRVPSGYVSPTGYGSGILSAHGNWHARMRVNQPCPKTPATNCSGPYTYFGKGDSFNPVFPNGGYSTEVDVYLDVPWVTGAPDRFDTRFDWSSAINGQTGTHKADLVFNVGTPVTVLEQTSDPGYYVNASTNATRSGAFPQNPCPNPSAPPNYCRAPIKIETSGWYTFRHRFYKTTIGGINYLGVDMTVRQHDTPVGSWTIYLTELPSGIGGDAYGWFAINEIQDLAIDCSSLKPPTTGHPPLRQPCTTGGGHQDDDDDDDDDD